MKKLMVLISIFLCNSALSNQLTSVQAPFGLTWGQSKNDIIKNNVALNNCVHYENITSCHTKNPPSPLDISVGYILTFSYTDGLIKVSAYTAPIENDEFRDDFQDFYYKYKQLISSKYKSSYIATHKLKSVNHNSDYLKFNFESPLPINYSAKLNKINPKQNAML